MCKILDSQRKFVYIIFTILFHIDLLKTCFIDLVLYDQLLNDNRVKYSPLHIFKVTVNCVSDSCSIVKKIQLTFLTCIFILGPLFGW